MATAKKTPKKTGLIKCVACKGTGKAENVANVLKSLQCDGKGKVRA